MIVEVLLKFVVMVLGLLPGHQGRREDFRGTTYDFVVVLVGKLWSDDALAWGLLDAV